MKWIFIMLIAGVAVTASRAEDLFDGKSLDGWKIVGAPNSAWLVKDGVLVCDGVAMPRNYMRTEEMFENFVLELEWKLNSPKGNSGVFLYTDALPQVGAPYPESIEAQIYALDHGSIFGIRGAAVEPITAGGNKGRTIAARPIEDRCRLVGEWNHYRITSKSGVLELAVNGKVVTRAKAKGRRRGYIALQSEHKLVHFRNIRVERLPTTNPPAETVAESGEGHGPLFGGVGFSGWKHLPGHIGHWTVHDGEIHYDGKASEKLRANRDLWTSNSFRDFELIVDWRLPMKPRMKDHPVVLPSGDFVYLEGRKRKTFKNLDAGDSGIYLRGTSKAQLNIWSQNLGSGEINGYRTDRDQSSDVRLACIPSKKADKPFGQWNRFKITMKGERVTVVLNGEKVIDRARLPGVPKTGPIALQHHNDPVEFRNLFIRELR